MVWEDDRAMKILRDKVDEAGYSVGVMHNTLINQKQFSSTFSPILKIRFPMMRMTKKGLKSLKKSKITL